MESQTSLIKLLMTLFHRRLEDSRQMPKAEERICAREKKPCTSERFTTFLAKCMWYMSVNSRRDHASEGTSRGCDWGMFPPLGRRANAGEASALKSGCQVVF